MRVWSLGLEDPLKEHMATHSSILAWRIAWTGEPGVLESMGVSKGRTKLEQLSKHGPIIHALYNKGNYSQYSITEKNLKNNIYVCLYIHVCVCVCVCVCVYTLYIQHRAFLVVQMIKNLPAVQGTWVQSLGWEDPLGKGMATHSSILAWRIPWAEEPDGLQSMGLQRVRHDWSNLAW